MNPIIKQRWLDALRSGKYTQGRCALRNNDNFCCLGVLCEVVKDDIALEVKLVTPVNSVVASFAYGKYGYFGFLPPEVILYAETGARDPQVGKHTCLELNDSLEYDFNQIADIIEKEL